MNFKLLVTMYLHPFVSRVPVYQILIMFIFIYTYTFSVLIPDYYSLFSLIFIFYISIKLFKNSNTINERRRLSFTYYILSINNCLLFEFVQLMGIFILLFPLLQVYKN